jgi:hypothetical protein
VRTWLGLCVSFKVVKLVVGEGFLVFAFFLPTTFAFLFFPNFCFKYLVVVFNVKMNNHLPAKFLESTASNGIMKMRKEELP